MSCARFHSKVKVPADLSPQLEKAKDALLSAFYAHAAPLRRGWMWDLEVKVEGKNLLLVGGKVREPKRS